MHHPPEVVVADLVQADPVVPEQPACCPVVPLHQELLLAAVVADQEGTGVLPAGSLGLLKRERSVVVEVAGLTAIRADDGVVVRWKACEDATNVEYHKDGAIAVFIKTVNVTQHEEPGRVSAWRHKQRYVDRRASQQVLQ
jgi:hypothetical protein